MFLPNSSKDSECMGSMQMSAAPLFTIYGFWKAFLDSVVKEQWRKLPSLLTSQVSLSPVTFVADNVGKGNVWLWGTFPSLIIFISLIFYSLSSGKAYFPSATLLEVKQIKIGPDTGKQIRGTVCLLSIFYLSCPLLFPQKL